MSPAELRYDAIVIGAGTAGLVAATRLAEQGARVCLLAKGIGCTHLAPGTVDVLGYAPPPLGDPASTRRPAPEAIREPAPPLVREPAPALMRLVAANPDHPYARIGLEALERALAWLAEIAASGPLPGYRYVGGLKRNWLLPTALGGLRPSALVPETFAAGDASELERLAIVGSPALRDFHPRLCAENLQRAGVQARALSVPLELDRADASALTLARRLEEPSFRARFCAELAPLLHDEDYVGLPAVLGLREPHAVWTELERRLGRRVFEIPTLPPSVPGMRLFDILSAALRRAGGRLVLGAEVVGARRQGARVLALSTRSAGHEHWYAGAAFVLASGGFASGAIELDSRWQARERTLGLALEGLPGPGEPRLRPGYFDEHPLGRTGVALGAQLWARDADNVLVAGAALPRALPWREGSGEGIALASGYRAAQLAIEDAGAGRTEQPAAGAAL